MHIHLCVTDTVVNQLTLEKHIQFVYSGFYFVSDAPNDANYMICGVVIAMALVGLIIVLLALTIK
jgi:hypothetical protein